MLFYFTSYVLNMFRTLIYPSSGGCDYSVELPHWSYCSWFRCVLEFRCGWVGVLSVLQDATWIPLQTNYITTLVVLFLVLMCVGVSVWLGWSGIRVASCKTDTTPTQPHRNSNTHRLKNNTTNVVIQQNSRKLPMMDILMSETC